MLSQLAKNPKMVVMHLEADHIYIFSFKLRSHQTMSFSDATFPQNFPQNLYMCSSHKNRCSIKVFSALSKTPKNQNLVNVYV